MSARRSRFRTEPRGIGFRLTATDHYVLELLGRFRFLPSSFLLAFLARRGRNTEYAKHRLTTLRHEARVIDCPVASWSAANARYRPAVYMLTARGRHLLDAAGCAPGHMGQGRAFRHELMVAIVHASFALGVADQPNLEMIDATEILAHPSCPCSTATLSDPFRMPLDHRHAGFQGGCRPSTLRHDGPPFAVARRQGERVARLFVPGIEADRRNEPLRPSDARRTSIRNHLEKILVATENGLYRRHLGIPNALVPFLTTSKVHQEAVMTLLLELTDGRGSSNVLFRSMPDFATFEGFPPATGHMLTEPWDRAGHPPFSFPEALRQGVEALTHKKPATEQIRCGL